MRSLSRICRGQTSGLLTSCSTPRILAEDRIGDVMDLITPDFFWNPNNRLFEQVVESFPEEFVLGCYHRVIARVTGPNYRKAGHDDWMTCFRFVSLIIGHSPPLCFLFLANKSLYWMVHGFRKQLSQHAAVNGRDAYVKFYPSLMHTARASFSDSHTWIPQAIKARLLPLMLKSSPHLKASTLSNPNSTHSRLHTPSSLATVLHRLRAKDRDVPERMKEVYFHLSTNLIHQEVLRCTMKAMRYLRKKFDNIESAVKVLEYISAADWVEHREECERNTTEKSKGKVLEADERSTTFIENHTSYLLKTRNFTQMALAYQMANPRTPSHMIVADPDYTNSPPTLSVKSALKYTGYDNFENIITDASENPGEGQVAHISVPFIHGKPERILTILYEDFVD
ncbi:hypothetical protein NLJ89_g3701 [Agrocybe chaxingu]|uniref:Uncharacterized protein n=1 Tax=Agrocybe chaxingu TaxID=84603 RepID=A0A9W8K575_9AGAR|nr:hypothetical protein NLJ89_g3701 [Agrocybe chaxingu]